MKKKSTQKIIRKEIPIPYYSDDPLTIIAAEDFEAAIKEIDFVRADDYSNTIALCIPANDGYYIVFRLEKDCCRVSVDTIAHEVMHFARNLLAAERAIDLTTETNEVYAYFVGYFVGKICEVFNDEGIGILCKTKK